MAAGGQTILSATSRGPKGVGDTGRGQDRHEVERAIPIGICDVVGNLIPNRESASRLSRQTAQVVTSSHDESEFQRQAQQDARFCERDGIIRRRVTQASRFKRQVGALPPDCRGHAPVHHPDRRRDGSADRERRDRRKGSRNEQIARADRDVASVSRPDRVVTASRSISILEIVVDKRRIVQKLDGSPDRDRVGLGDTK